VRQVDDSRLINALEPTSGILLDGDDIRRPTRWIATKIGFTSIPHSRAVSTPDIAANVRDRAENCSAGRKSSSATRHERRDSFGLDPAPYGKRYRANCPAVRTQRVGVAGRWPPIRPPY